MGKLIWLMGPSGSDKDSLLAEPRQQEPAQLLVMHHYITRIASAENENHIVPSEQKLFTHAGQNLLALGWYASGFYYGVSAEINLWLYANSDMVVNDSRTHLPQAQAHYGTSLFPIYLRVPPTILHQRLQARRRKNETEIAVRLECVTRYTPYDCHVLNNNGSLLQSVNTLLTLMGHERKRHVHL